MNRGGIESFMMNYYRHFDRSKIQIDFAVHDAGGEGFYDKEIESMGGCVFHLPRKFTHPFSYADDLRQIIITGGYKIVHTHMDAMGAWVLKVAKECGVPVRIAHSHNTQHLTSNPIKLYFLEKARRDVVKYASERMACSEAAGKWLFGDYPFTVVHNAIEVGRFEFDAAARKQVRSELGISDNEFVIGHIGRFDFQKNHVFLINLFAKLLRIIPSARLVLVGGGQ